MLKVIGAGMIVVCCSLAGHTVAQAFAGRPKQLRILQAALQQLETEIVYGAAPISEVLERLAERGDPFLRGFYALVLKNLSTNRGCSLAEAWAEALCQWQEATFLTKDDLQTLAVLGDSLGISNRQDQQQHLRAAKEKLGQSEDSAREIAERAVKPWNYLGFLGGLVVVLIFI